MSRYIVDLAENSALAASRSGGKGAGLAWLHRQGFAVPPGFVITTEAFRAFLRAAGPGCEDARSALSAAEDVPLPGQVEGAIRRAYQRLGGSVAVRSSLVAEDAPKTSFAGQLDTYLDVEGEEDVLAAVRRCWASLCSARVGAYLGQNAVPAHALQMAVVVQRMVKATAAGVAFSADPLTGEAHVVIEGTVGRGDAVVRGVALTDRYVVDARGDLVEVTATQLGRDILSRAQVQDIAAIVREIERCAGSSQDVEWAWDGVTLYMLQTRPITTLLHHHVYSRRVVGEMAPGLIKPMVYEVNVLPKATQVFGRLFSELLGSDDADYAKLVSLIHSRVYGDMTLMGELLTRAGLPPNFIEMMYQEERARSGRMHMSMGMMRPMGRLGRFIARQARLADRAERGTAACDAELVPYRAADWSGVATDALVSQLDRLIASRNEFFWLFFLVTVSMILRTGALKRWTGRKAPDVPFGDLIRGLSGLKGLEPMAEIERLAALARTLSPDELALLAEADEATLRAWLEDTEVGRELMTRMDGFLANYGYLSSNGSDFSVPVWNENPALIWRAVGRSAALPAVISSYNSARIRADALQRVRDRLNPTLCPAFNRLFASAVTYIGLRERISLLMSEYSFEMRRLFLAIAARLVEAGRLEQPDEVFYLTYDEMKALVGGTVTGEDARALVAARGAQLAADAGVNPPDIVRGDPANLRALPLVDAQSSECLIGIGGSAGVVHGRARVVYDPVHAPAILDREDILVVPYSDVGWTPLFPAVGGVVAETGGQLSHTAIIAREYGLPAVVSVKGAMRLIREGQPLVVDGDRGRVHLEQMPA